MDQNNKIVWGLRILVAILFVGSAAMKLFPIEAFEHQLVTEGITNICFAPLFARGIIGIEFFLGIAFLQNHYFRKFILPATAAMLLVFCIHLIYTIATTGNAGNCGCMGQIIPMTPAQALTKNIITLLILGYIRLHIKAKKDSLHRYPLIILAVCLGGMFLCYKPSCACDIVNEPITNITIPEVLTPADSLPADTAAKLIYTPPVIGKGKTEPVKIKDTVKTKPAEPEPVKITRVKSVFAPYTSFSDGAAVNLDAGKHTVCLFNSDCEHCMATAKQLCELGRDMSIPPVYILFWGEESQTANFFKVAGCTFPYKFIDAGQFFRLLDKAPSPPRVVVLNEGHIVGDFTSESFTKNAFQEAIK